MWIKFTKDSAANERLYKKGDTALFQDELGQKMVEGGFAEYFDPGDSKVLVNVPHVPGSVGENVEANPVAVNSKDVVVDNKGVASSASKNKFVKPSKIDETDE